MLRYRLEGSGDPLLLIHGWGVSYTIWQNLVPLLKSHFQLIMIELPGIGGSPSVDANLPYYQACADAIEEVRQELGIVRWDVLAYSSGTRAAEAYVRQYPQSIKHAIFLCPTYILEIWALFLRLLSTPHPATWTQWFLSDWRLAGLVRMLGFNWHHNDYTDLWVNEIKLQPLNSLVRSLCEMPGNGRAPFYLPSLPTLFIWGGRDALIAPPRKIGPHDVVLPMADHSAPMLEAVGVAEAVLLFLLEDRVVSKPARSLWRSYRSPYKVLRRGKRRSTQATFEQRRLLDLLSRPGRRNFSLRRRSDAVLQRVKRR